MEVKKSNIANLDNKRSTGFLLGLIVALALCFVALEYAVGPKEEYDDSEVLDDLTEDIPQLPLTEQKDMIAAVAPPKSSPAVTEKLREVTQTATPDEVDKVNLDTKSETTGNVATEEKTSEETADKTTALSPVPIDENSNVNFRIVEQLPEFPGGMVEFMKWLTKTLQYPPTAKVQKIQGTVMVQFIIGADGSVSNIKIAKAADPLLNREALRVAGMMPKWKPGQQNGKPCRTLFEIPIVFSL